MKIDLTKSREWIDDVDGLLSYMRPRMTLRLSTSLARCIAVARAACEYADANPSMQLMSDMTTASLLAAIDGKRYVDGIVEEIV